MSEAPNQSIPDWLSLLEALLDSDQQVDRQGTHHAALIAGLSDLFAGYMAMPYWTWLGSRRASWLPPETKRPPANQPPQVEMSALSAVARWLEAPTALPPGAPQADRAELLAARRRLKRATRARRESLASAEEFPWAGHDWDELEPQVSRLLTYMHGREEADLSDLSLQVWGKDYAKVTDHARETTTSKANKFLRKRERSRVLRKVRGEPRLRWE